MKRSPACQLASPVEEETPTTHEDSQTMLGKRPVHESVDGLPLMQIIADLVHSYTRVHESVDGLPFDADHHRPARSYIQQAIATHVHESVDGLPFDADHHRPAHGGSEQARE